MLPVWATALLPVLAGMFLGAPLVARDTELGLQRVAWTQSVSRRRWLAVKLGLVVLPVLGGVAALVWLGMQACVHQAGLRFVVDFQPAERYWTFQGIEAAMFGLLALALVALTVWWVRHRIS